MKFKKIIKPALIILLSLIVVTMASIFIYCKITIDKVRDYDLSLDKDITKVVSLYDKYGDEKLLRNNEYNDIQFNDLPPYLISAFISIEDKEYFKHNGINIKRIVKSAIDNTLSGRIVSGGSTITQQLIKNKFLTDKQTIERKVQEIYLAKKLEKMYSKEEIFTSYLNEIYYGNGAYGIKSASLRFFSKDVKDLTLSESSVLAGCINSPSTYSPINNIENSLKRRNLVLEQMLEDGYITESAYLKAINEPIILNPSELKTNTKLDLYDKFALEEASQILGIAVSELYNKGYKIYTNKDPDLQSNLEERMSSQDYYPKNNYGNTADGLGMIVDNQTHTVSAVAGNSEYNLIGVKRQPGSIIKPVLVYAPAIEEGVVTPITQIEDSEINYSGYSPNNVGNKLSGYVSIRDAIADSLNIPAVKVCGMVGLEKCKEYAMRVGLDFHKKDTGYALALGGTTEGYTLQELIDSYSPFINSGSYIKSTFINKIIDNNNMTVYSNILSENKVYGSDTAYIMTDMLKYAVETGTSKKLSNFDYDIAGKTGTVGIKGTNYNTDVYSLAYTSEHTMAVWFGNYSMDKEYYLEGNNNGGTYATQLIADTFDIIYQDNKPQSFIKPDTVVDCDIDLYKLNTESVVYLGEDLPDRYKLSTTISNRYLPTKYNYDNDNYINLKAVNNGDSIDLIFTSNNLINYKIYKVLNNETTLLHEIRNKNEVIKYTDSDILNNNKYDYYIEGYNTITNNTFKSDTISIYTNILQNNSLYEFSFNWLFEN